MDLITYLVLSLASFAAGGVVVGYLKSRPVTSKAEAMKLLAIEARLIGKMSGAADDLATAQLQVQAETLAAAALSAQIASLNAPVA